MLKFKPHIEVLPQGQLQLWPELRTLAQLRFILYGGTAVALRLGHRTSVDFDFFTEKPLDKEAIQSAFTLAPTATVLQEQENTWVLLISIDANKQEFVKVSFFGNIAFGRIGEPEFTEDNVLCVASLADLMATKLKVLLQRSEAKDYRDIAAMLTAQVSLPAGLSAARLLYGPNFQPSESLKALTYFKDGDLQTLTAAEKQTLIEAAASVRELPKVERLSTSLS